jgi:Zn-dependent M16 (insulinase) family peptidase
MARNPVIFSNGILLQKAQVEIDGTTYDVEPAQYDGTTPLSANNLNLLQTRLYDYIDEQGTEKTQEINDAISTLTNNVYVKNNFAILTGNINVQQQSPTNRYFGSKTFNYPTGFSKNNSIVISCMISSGNNLDTPMGITSNGYVSSTLIIHLRNNDISAVGFDNSASGNHSIKIVLLKYTD